MECAYNRDVHSDVCILAPTVLVIPFNEMRSNLLLLLLVVVVLLLLLLLLQRYT